MKLTQSAVEKLKVLPGKSERIEWDDTLPGFGVRVREGGSRTWIVQYKIGDKHRRITLGSTAMLNAEQARNGWEDAAGQKHNGAALILVNAKHGNDAANTRNERRASAALTVEAAVGDFLTFQQARCKASYFAETKRYMNETWKPLHGLSMGAVTRAQVAATLGKVAQQSGPVAADRARAALSKFFNWAIAEGRAMANPVDGTNRATDGLEARDRVLSDAELSSIWNATDAESDYGRIVRLLILTAQRREEISALRWSEIDLEAKQISLPGERTKNGRPHITPLSDDAVAILRAIPQREGRDLVFGRGDGAFSGFSKAKHALDKASGISNWTLHDLRRTGATRMGDVGVLPHVVEATLNHISGHRKGVAGTYNRALYLPEKREALERLAGYVMTAVAQAKSGNIRRLRSAS